MAWRISLTGAVAAIAVAVVTAAAAGAPARGGATLRASSTAKFVINKYAQDTSRFTPGAVTIRSGGTLTISVKGQAPHSFSIVKRSELPRTPRQIEQCAVCQTLAQAHGADPNSDAPPTKPVVDVGAAGIDQAGDSVFLPPRQTQRLKVTAKNGTTLSFICAVHPWMQGKLQVR
jgi:plastocyanin